MQHGEIFVVQVPCDGPSGLVFSYVGLYVSREVVCDDEYVLRLGFPSKITWNLHFHEVNVYKIYRGLSETTKERF